VFLRYVKRGENLLTQCCSPEGWGETAAAKADQKPREKPTAKAPTAAARRRLGVLKRAPASRQTAARWLKKCLSALISPHAKRQPFSSPSCARLARACSSTDPEASLHALSAPAGRILSLGFRWLRFRHLSAGPATSQLRTFRPRP